MRHRKSSWVALFAAGLVALCLGCKGENGKPAPNGGQNGGSAQVPEGPGGAETPGVAEPPGDVEAPSPGGNGGESRPDETPPGGPNDGNQGTTDQEPGQPAVDVAMPEVQLPEMLKATCLVGVGDAMPDAPLDVLGGEQQQLSSLFGRRLTVMFFWESDNLYAQDELRDLTGDVAEAFGDKGVRVIGINVGDSAETAAAAVEAAEAAFPNFLDPQGEYFAKVATERLPRTYLLDSAGRILWFDLEYSLTTRRQLKQAVEVALSRAPAAKPPSEDPLVAERPEPPAPEVETPEPPPEPETLQEPTPEPETPDEPSPEVQQPEAPPPASEALDVPEPVIPASEGGPSGEGNNEEAESEAAAAPVAD